MRSPTIGKKWVVKRKSDTEVQLELPKGMKFTSKKIGIEDIVEAVKLHAALKEGDVTGKGTLATGGDTITLRCCNPSTAVTVL